MVDQEGTKDEPNTNSKTTTGNTKKGSQKRIQANTYYNLGSSIYVKSSQYCNAVMEYQSDILYRADTYI